MSARRSCVRIGQEHFGIVQGHEAHIGFVADGGAIARANLHAVDLQSALGGDQIAAAAAAREAVNDASPALSATASTRASLRMGSASSSPSMPLASVMKRPLQASRVKDFRPQLGGAPRRSGSIQIWKTCAGPPSILNSACVTPLPALTTCTSPARVRPRLPRSSSWVSAPSRTQVMISTSECNKGGNPAPGAMVSSFHARSAPQFMRSGSW